MEWIKTEEQNPDFGVRVLVFCKLYGFYIGSYEYIGEFDGIKFGNWSDGNSIGVLPPTYWMPLPKPPKE